MKFYAWLSVVSQILIVVTGGLVRLTGSGLGCPTWPECEPGSLTNVPELGIHGVIEFANRLLTFVLLAVAIFTFINVLRLGKGNRKGLFWTSFALGLGIIAQAVLGGITVLTGLNAWIVGAHFLVSGVLISVATVLLWYSKEKPRLLPDSGSKLIATLMLPTAIAVVVIGVIVTGSGPHAGDADTPRNGLDSSLFVHLHSYPAYLLLALVVALILRRFLKTKEHTGFILLAVLLAQAILGLSQTWLGLPIELVTLHLLGASVLISMVSYQLLINRVWFDSK